MEHGRHQHTGFAVLTTDARATRAMKSHTRTTLSNGTSSTNTDTRLAISFYTRPPMYKARFAFEQLRAIMGFATSFSGLTHVFWVECFNVYKVKFTLYRSLLEWILQNQGGHLMLFTQQKSYHFYTTETLFQTVKEV